MQPSSLFLPKFSHLSGVNTHWIIAVFCLTSRVLKKLILAVFADVLITFMGKKSIFESPEMLLPCTFNITISVQFSGYTQSCFFKTRDLFPWREKALSI